MDEGGTDERGAEIRQTVSLPPFLTPDATGAYPYWHGWLFKNTFISAEGGF